MVFGVEDRDRSSFKIWEEGKPPDFVLEVASPSTAEQDAFHKAQEYARIGVREYWRLDPEGSSMGTPLEGYVARGASYERVEPVRGRLQSGVLGLNLRSERQGRGGCGGVLRPAHWGGIRWLSGIRRAEAKERGGAGECGRG